MDGIQQDDFQRGTEKTDIDKHQKALHLFLFLCAFFSFSGVHFLTLSLFSSSSHSLWMRVRAYECVQK